MCGGECDKWATSSRKADVKAQDEEKEEGEDDEAKKSTNNINSFLQQSQ